MSRDSANTGRLWVAAWIGLGSNLGNPESQVSQAILQLKGLPHTRLWRVSSLYSSAPMGPSDQPDYVNAVAGILTRLGARDLLEALQAVEREAGRRRDPEARWGPRTLDLDILSYGTRRIDTPELSVPHPGIPERNFVLLPLFEVAPALQLPGLPPLEAMLSVADRESIRRLSRDTGAVAQ